MMILVTRACAGAAQASSAAIAAAARAARRNDAAFFDGIVCAPYWLGNVALIADGATPQAESIPPGGADGIPPLRADQTPLHAVKSSCAAACFRCAAKQFETTVQRPRRQRCAQGVSQYTAPFKSESVSATKTLPAVPRETDSSRTPTESPIRSCRTSSAASAPRSNRSGPVQCTASRGPSPALIPPRCSVGRTPNVLEKRPMESWASMSYAVLSSENDDPVRSAGSNQEAATPPCATSRASR